MRDASTGNTTALAVFVTADGGRSWRQAAATGLLASPGSNILRDLVVSPAYASDHALYVQTDDGLFVSVDHADTFLPVDPLALGRLTPYVAEVASPVGGGAARHALIAHALRGDAEGANRSMIIDPSTRIRTPVKGSPGRDWEFLISPGFARDGLAYVIAEHGVGLTRRFQLYGCSPALECSTPLHRFPARWTFDRMWLAPDFTTSRAIYASIRPPDKPLTLWRSVDGGRKFTRWTAAERLQPNYSAVAFGLAGVPGTRQLYLRISGNAERGRSSAPYEQLFLSKDSGATWARVSYGRSRFQQGPRGSMPAAQPDRFLGDGDTARGMVAATGNGRVFMLGRTYHGANRYDSLFCTVDNGRSWSRYCPR